MSSKHFINDSSLLVLTALQSVTYTNPTTALDRENKIIYVRPDAIKKQVSIVSGGGAGHEPSFSSFVGPGLLAGAVSGTIFASPSAEQIRRCIFGRVDTSQGVLVIVMNYTGDVLNFGMAVEKAKAAGIKVEMVVVGDDAGVCRKQGGKVGRRGIAGTVLVQKIAGALAAAGASLHEVHSMAKAVAENTVSIGSSLSHVHVPGRGVGGDDELKADEVEIGMGIHNETGSERVSSDLPGTVTRMLKHMLDQHDEDRAFLKVNSDDQTVLLVNNLGGTSVLEMGGITTEVVTQLEADWKIKPVRILAGTYMTSLNGLGFSISLLRLTEGRMLELLDAPAEAAGWTAAVKTHTWTSRPAETREGDAGLGSEVAAAGIAVESSYAKAALNAALDSVIEAEPEVTKYDSIVGDGDCGIGLKRGAQAVKEYLRAAEETDAALLLDGIIEVVESAMDGTSGALYAIFLNALANGIRQQKGQETQSATPQIWAHALARAMESLSRYTPARVGDRTLMDALSPFADELKSSGSVQSAAAAAEKGAENTKGMKASLGRTVYIGGDGYGDIPDPGAYGLAQFFKGLAVGLQ